MITVNVHLNEAPNKPEIITDIYSDWGTVLIKFGYDEVKLFVHDLGKLRRLSELLKEIVRAQPQVAASQTPAEYDPIARIRAPEDDIPF